MTLARITSSILISTALVMSARHGAGLIRSSPDQVQELLGLRLEPMTIWALGALTTLAGILLLAPQTFFAANVLTGGVIFYLAAAQSNARNFSGMVMELPFLILPLVLLYLGHPLKSR